MPATNLQTKKKDQTMNTKNKDVINTLYLTQGGAKIIAATYVDGDRQYNFLNAVGLTLEKGDRVIVQTRGDFSLVTVADPDVSFDELACPLEVLVHVVDKVDFKTFNSIMDAEVEASKKLAAVQINKKLADFQEAIGRAALDTASDTLLGITAVAPVVEKTVPQPVTHWVNKNGDVYEANGGALIGLGAEETGRGKPGHAHENVFSWVKDGVIERCLFATIPKRG